MDAIQPETQQPETQIWPGLTGCDVDGPFIVGGRCGQCDFVVLGPHEFCPRCWARSAIAIAPVGRRGTLYSYTVIAQLPAGYDAPFAVGYVDIEDGLRVFAHLRNDPATLKIGGAVALEVVPLTRDQAVGPRYHAVPTGNGGA